MGDRGETGLPAQMARKLQRRSANEDVGGLFGDVELGGDPVWESEDPDLRWFDLDSRAALIPAESEWAVDAKARAESIRFGNENYISWWGMDKRVYPLERVRLKADTGVHDFRVNPSCCEAIHS